jgi:hypothetical protein
MVTLVPAGVLATKDFAELQRCDCHAESVDEGDPKIVVRHTVEQSARRIQPLLASHSVLMVGATERWIVEAPASGVLRVVIGVRVR